MGGCYSRRDSAAASAFTPRAWVRLARVFCWNHPRLLRVAHGKQDGVLCHQALWFLLLLLPRRTLCSGTISFTWVQSHSSFLQESLPYLTDQQPKHSLLFCLLSNGCPLSPTHSQEKEGKSSLPYSPKPHSSSLSPVLPTFVNSVVNSLWCSKPWWDSRRDPRPLCSAPRSEARCGVTAFPPLFPYDTKYRRKNITGLLL